MSDNLISLYLYRFIVIIIVMFHLAIHALYKGKGKSRAMMTFDANFLG